MECIVLSTVLLSFTHGEGEGQPSNDLWLKRVCLIYHFKHCYGFHCIFQYVYSVLSILHVSRVCLACLRFIIRQKQCVPSQCVFVGLMLRLCHKVSFFRQPEKQNWNVIFLYRIRVWRPQWQSCWKKPQWRSKLFTNTLNMIRLKLTPIPPHPKQCSCNLFTLSWKVFAFHNVVCWGKGKP